MGLAEALEAAGVPKWKATEMINGGHPQDMSNFVVAFDVWLLLESEFYATHEPVYE